MAAIFPSLISSNLLTLGTTIQEFSPYCTGYHLDVMDGHFVPSITWGDPFIHAIRHVTNAPLWVHLMLDNPATYIQSLYQSDNTLGNTIISFHLEAFMTEHEIAQAHTYNKRVPYTIERIQEVRDLMHNIRKNGQRPSIALNPLTPVSCIFELFPMLDHVLIMSVYPGKSGQQFLPETDAKVAKLIDHVYGRNFSITIAVDGGITREHCVRLAALGVGHFAAAAAIFHVPDPIQALKELQEIPRTIL